MTINRYKDETAAIKSAMTAVVKKSKALGKAELLAEMRPDKISKADLNVTAAELDFALGDLVDTIFLTTAEMFRRELAKQSGELVD